MEWIHVEKARIAVIGGSGIYSLFEKPKQVKMKTPYGSPSDKISIGKIAGRKVAFLPRHGRKHQYPPHMIPYQANLWALKDVGVERIIAPCAVGSLQPHIKRGDFVICDQFVNKTWGRKDTYFNGPVVNHISTADPYCDELRRLTVKAARKFQFRVHERGTVVVVQGPRLGTKAESCWFKSFGWDVINMTQYPEVTLARELGICYVNISLVTDYDAWSPDVASAKEIFNVIAENIENFKNLIKELVPEIPKKRNCQCSKII